VSVAFFIRHGKASAFASSSDYDDLSPPGVEQSERLGEWLALRGLSVDAVFVGPRRRHAQTLATVVRVLSARGMALPEATLLPELDEHDGMSLLLKILPDLATQDPALAAIFGATAAPAAAEPSASWEKAAEPSASSGRGDRPSLDQLLTAFKHVTRRWALGEVGHEEVESWPAFRARVGRAMSTIAALGRGKTALVFTSAGTVASATAEALGVKDEQRVLDLSWSLYNASVTELDFTGERWGLRTFNGTAHLVDKRLVTSV
jgi:broad specificity phosphatase PhoE